LTIEDFGDTPPIDNLQSKIGNRTEGALDLPARVIIFCPTLELKNKPGRLMAVSPHGYYEVWLDFADRNHAVLLPITGTALVFAEPNSTAATIPGIER
jgi:hypothetical protein